MAEVCYKCLEKSFEEDSKEMCYNENDFYKEYDLCEECGEYKQCVIALNAKGRFKQIFFKLIGLD